MNRKGQLSFEFLLLTLVIFSLAIVIAGYHFAEQDVTNAMLIAKSEVLSQLNAQGDLIYIISPGIEYAIPIAGTIDLRINLSKNPDPAIDTASIEHKLVANTNFTTANVDIYIT